MTNSRKKTNHGQPETEVELQEDRRELRNTTEQLRQQFGEFVSMRRKQLRNPKLSQADAARRVGIRRETWNRIERGSQLPDPVNIPAIAETLKVGPVRLFRRAGYDVPIDFQIDARKKLIRDFLACWDESTSAAQFLFGMLGIWLMCKLEEDEKYRRVFMDLGFIQILLAIEQNLTRPQQLRLAAELIQRTVIELPQERIDACKRLEEIDSELDRIKRIEARSLGGLYEIRSLDDMGQYHFLITDEDLSEFLAFVRSRTKE